MEYIAFTVKDNNRLKWPTVEDYEDWMRNAEKKGFHIEVYYYELDSKDRLHMHGVGAAKKGFYKKSLTYKNMHQRLDVIPSFIDLQQWAQYISKDYKNVDEYQQMLFEYHNRHSCYPFIE